RGVLHALRVQGPGTYFITTRSQEAFVVFGQGFPPGWGERFRRTLASTRGVRVVVDGADASIYTLAWPRETVAKPFVPAATGVEVRRTPWTPVGVAFVVLLVAVLGAREAWRACLATGEQRRLRPLSFAAVPLLIGLALVV